MLDVEEYESKRMPSGVTRLKWQLILHPLYVLVLLVLLANALIILFVLLPWSRTGSDRLVVAYNNLDRDSASRAESLLAGYKAIKVVASLHKNCPNDEPTRSCVEGLYEEGEESFFSMIQRSKDYVMAMEALGLLEPEEVEKILPGYVGDTAQPDTPQLPTTFDRDLFCYENGYTFGGKPYPVDPELCDKLEELFDDIISGRSPPLLTVFTWWPGPIFDMQKFSRKTFWANLGLLQPFVKPVLAASERHVMATANDLGWSCLPITYMAPDGKPLFKPLARAMAQEFPSTFYGYVHASTLLDVSLLHTLIAVQEQLTHGAGPEKPFLLSGKSWFSESPNTVDSFTGLHKDVGDHMARVARRNPIGPEHNRYYMVYSNIHMDAMPDLSLDPDFIGSFITQKSTLLSSLVVNGTFTVWSLHIIRNKTQSEWSREYITNVGQYLNYNWQVAREHTMRWGGEVGENSLILQSKFVPGWKLSFETDRDTIDSGSGNKRDTMVTGHIDRRDSMETEQASRRDTMETGYAVRRDRAGTGYVDRRDRAETGYDERRDRAETGYDERRDRAETGYADRRDTRETGYADRRDTMESGQLNRRDTPESGQANRRDIMETGQANRREAM